jgi:hypothetical protein
VVSTRANVDRSPGSKEFGYRPADGQTCRVTPPPFVWVRQRKAKSYQLQVSTDETFAGPGVLTFGDIIYNLYTPAEALEPGQYWWRYRFVTADGSASDWSRARKFVIDHTAKPFPFITPEQCRQRLPKRHPRLMLRPEQVQPLRRRIGRERQLGEIFAEIRKKADSYLTAELIPEPTVMASAHDPKTRKHWWPNRVTTLRALTVADTLAFVYLMTGEDTYGKAARRWILHMAAWSPIGPTNHLLNDEAAMPFLYLLPRAYDWAYDALSNVDRAKVRHVMKIRTQTAYSVLRGMQHLNCPFESHNNRLWHWLGESAICFYDEIDQAPEWLDYALNYYFAIYPVWGGADGGWHEGANYWNSYVYRSLYWMDVARAALQFEPLIKPYYQRVGDFALYVVPPHTPVGGFGDLSHYPPGRTWRYTIEYFARRIRNPYWQWWAEQKGGQHERGLYGLLRQTNSKPIRPRPPRKLPTSKLFGGVGVAALHTTLLDARQDVTFLFKSSPYGGQSHGHNPQNSFILCAYGDELLSACVYRDEHGGKWHRTWAWSTHAHNALLVDQKGQPKNASTARGQIVAFQTDHHADYVAGDATEAYANVKRFIRHVVFAKPDAIVILDDVETRQPATFQWMLHGLVGFELDQELKTARLERSRAGVEIAYLSPLALTFRQTSGYDPQPLRAFPTQWHLEAGTTEKRHHMLMLTVLCPYRRDQRPRVSLKRIESDTAVGCLVTTAGKKRSVVFRKPGISGRAKVGALSFNGAAALSTGSPTLRVFLPEINQ